MPKLVTSVDQLRAYAAAFQMLPDIIFLLKGPDRTYSMANESLARLCNADGSEAVIGKAPSDFFDPEYAEWCDELDEQIMSGVSYARRLDCLDDPNGNRHWTIYSRRSIKLKNGDDYILGVSQLLKFDPGSERKRKRLRIITDKLHFHIDHSWTLQKMAKLGDVSVSQMERDFNDVLYQSPKDYLDHSRINLSKDLIRQGCDFVDIAPRIGLSEQSAFSRFFKRMTSMTPTAYRDLPEIMPA